MRSQRGLGLKIVLIQKDTESNKLIRKRWLYNGIWFSPNRVGKKKKVFAHSSQYDSGHLKDQTSIPVKPDIFQVLFQPLRLFIQLHGSC